MPSEGTSGFLVHRLHMYLEVWHVILGREKVAKVKHFGMRKVGKQSDISLTSKCENLHIVGAKLKIKDKDKDSLFIVRFTYNKH